MSDPDIYTESGLIRVEKIGRLIEKTTAQERTITAMRSRAIELQAKINRLTGSLETLQQVIMRSLEYEKHQP